MKKVRLAGEQAKAKDTGGLEDISLVPIKRDRWPSAQRSFDDQFVDMTEQEERKEFPKRKAPVSFSEFVGGHE